MTVKAGPEQGQGYQMTAIWNGTTSGVRVVRMTVAFKCWIQLYHFRKR